MFSYTHDLTSLDANNWNVANVTDSDGICSYVNSGLVVYCDQGGAIGTSDLFGMTCY